MNKLEQLREKYRSRNAKSPRPHLEAASNLVTTDERSAKPQDTVVVTAVAPCPKPAAPTEAEFSVKYITDPEAGW